MKNKVYIIIVVLCLVLAGVIFLFTRSADSGGIESIKPGNMVVKCSNPACGVVYETDRKVFYAELQDFSKKNPSLLRTPGAICKKCGKQSVFEAVRCEKCGEIFFYGNPNDYADRCPKCGFSKIEADRKAKASGR